ncbi:hypothetical protein SD70_17275 [Gordoniibacillus kamchatkensis]|uniref:DUF4912 domain-containing protein n=1 Tax=Gordoniibacillus kamchatkensis TaxID=1590651 RepID=A0ABR5AGL9_9BACL|nr:hypothetical protein SD70_17275 [Paenibacillus sp. VKM B-2647]
MNAAMLSGFQPPDLYHKDLLHLMVRDAHSLYAYWEVSNRKKWLASQHFKCDWGVLPKVLRLYDVTYLHFNGHNANSSRDIELTPEANNWYIHGVNANATYAADLGVYTWERQFVPLIRSNFVHTPRDAKYGWGEPALEIVAEAGEREGDGYIPPYYFENFRAFKAGR